MKYSSIFIVLLSFLCLPGSAQDYRTAEPYAGEQQLKKFICQEMIYPETELNAKIEGTVLLTFLIDSDGDMNNIKIKESVSPGIDGEAERILRKSIWLPAYKLGRPISTYVYYSVKFNIKKYNKSCRKRGYEEVLYPFQPVDSSNHVYQRADVNQVPKPVFNDPDQTVNKFIQKNLKYPEEAFNKDISGIVVLRFIVETNGKISHIVPEESLGGGCTQEASRVISLFNWMPGLQKGCAVRTMTTMSITFRLADSQDLQYVPSGQNQGI